MRSRSAEKISISYVARLAIISKVTLSKTLNGKPALFEDTRTKIRRNGYSLYTRIQKLAKEKRTGSTRSIAFVLVNAVVPLKAWVALEAIFMRCRDIAA